MNTSMDTGIKRTFEPSEIIVREGDYGDRMYIVKEGRVRISKTIFGQEKVLAEIGRGQFFGELSLINNKDRAATAIAIDHVEVLELDWETFQENIHQHSSVARQMIRTLARRLDNTLEKANSLNDVLSDRTRDLETKTFEAVEARRVAESASEKLKTSETRLENIIRSMGDGILVLDRASRVRIVNQAFTELIDSTQHELVGREFRELIAPDDILYLTGLEGVVTGGAVRDMHVAFLPPSGKRKATEVTASAILDDENAVDGYVLIAHDVTEMQRSLDEQSKLYAKQQEVSESLKQARDELEQANRKKTVFFQSVSHELRTPLTTILNPLEREHQENPDNSNVKLAIKSARGLLKVVNQILDFQNLASGTKAVRPAPLDLTQIIETCGEHFKGHCERREVNFILNQNGTPLSELTPDCEHIFVEADLDGLETIAYNFLSNALKFSNRGDTIELVGELQSY